MLVPRFKTWSKVIAQFHPFSSITVRCVLSLLESMANHMITKESMGVYSDKFMKELLQVGGIDD